MRRWFLSRFYRLGFGGLFGPASSHVDKAAVRTAVLGDQQLKSEVDP